ncbi:MAG TPA: type II toxin-antitoxin system PemK/MazF family toxin [Pyrinomonadaceae bacterium]|nr:type II toxin-antitoxin system PemK/MazF family toxin [Pyrinomonadaceae bacterium]
MKRGEVYWADLAPRSGSEQQGRRPVIVVSSDALNHIQSWRSIIVVPLSTSAIQRRRGPSAILLPPGTTGLRKESVALCHQVTTLDRSKFSRRIGELSLIELNLVEDGLKAVMDLL